MQKKRDYNYIYYFLQLVLVGLMIMFICTHFAGVTSTLQFAESERNIKMCLYCLLFSCLPYILKKWNIHSTKTLQVYYLIAIMAHFIGGNTLHYYRFVWFYSFVVHFINSFLIATIIYGMLLRHCKNQSKFFMFIATMAFTVLIGVLWEFCEYFIDEISGRNMQRWRDSITDEPFIGRVALKDTMIDLMMDSLGGALAGIYFAFSNIKGVPLYKFLELKYVKADTNISYQEDAVENPNIIKAKAEKKALKLEQKNVKRKNKLERKQQKAIYKQDKLKVKQGKQLEKKSTKTTKAKSTKSTAPAAEVRNESGEKHEK